ncbi:MAG: hypothetical protein H5T86_05750 [Armatimonadetes bacterium]|nr:hypothetical protein [Armatimonadota bacterium]
MDNVGVWVGFFTTIGAATAMVSFLVWQQASASQVPPQRVCAAIAQLWAAVVVALASGLGLRMTIGGEVFSLGRSPGLPLGLWVRHLRAHEALAAALFLVVIALSLLWARRAIRSVTGTPRENRDDSQKWS